jgi:hypothetical protein
MCSLNRITPDCFNRDASIALRVSSEHAVQLAALILQQIEA